MDSVQSTLSYQYSNELSRKSASLIQNQKGRVSDEMKAAIRKSAGEFEAVFLTTMLEGMFSGLKTDPPFGGGPAEKNYRSLLVSEYASELARSGGVGIADHVYREILAVQEGQAQ